jgi:hypothetical protein
MKRVLVSGTAVALGDGSLLGVAMGLGWTPVAAIAAVVGVVGAVLVAMSTPAPRPASPPATVTLGLPLRDTAAEAVVEVEAPDTEGTRTHVATVGRPATPVAA